MTREEAEGLLHNHANQSVSEARHTVIGLELLGLLKLENRGTKLGVHTHKFVGQWNGRATGGPILSLQEVQQVLDTAGLELVEKK